MAPCGIPRAATLEKRPVTATDSPVQPSFPLRNKLREWKNLSRPYFCVSLPPRLRSQRRPGTLPVEPRGVREPRRRAPGQPAGREAGPRRRDVRQLRPAGPCSGGGRKPDPTSGFRGKNTCSDTSPGLTQLRAEGLRGCPRTRASASQTPPPRRSPGRGPVPREGPGTAVEREGASPSALLLGPNLSKYFETSSLEINCFKGAFFLCVWQKHNTIWRKKKLPAKGRGD